MGFTEDTKRNAFERANGCCEICGKRLVFGNRGRNGGRGSWEAHHKKPKSEGGTDTLRNCMILCYQCHQQPQKAVSRKSKNQSPDDIIFGGGILGGGILGGNNKKGGGGFLW